MLVSIVKVSKETMSYLSLFGIIGYCFLIVCIFSDLGEVSFKIDWNNLSTEVVEWSMFDVAIVGLQILTFLKDINKKIHFLVLSFVFSFSFFVDSQFSLKKIFFVSYRFFMSI